MDNEQLVRQTWDAVSHGDLAKLEAALAPDATWRAVEDGPWNCRDRAAILEVMGRNVQGGVTGTVEDVVEVADRAVVAFRPARPAPGAWPLDGGVRYVVVSTRDGLITEIKGCADRASAFVYAAGSV